MDKCFFCKGTMQNSFTSYTINLDEHRITIKNLPCHKCTQCGKISFSGEIVPMMEKS